MRNTHELPMMVLKKLIMQTQITEYAKINN